MCAIRDSYRPAGPAIRRESALGPTRVAAAPECNSKGMTIVVAERLEPNARVVVGIHELAHALVAENDDPPKLTYAGTS